VKRRNAILVASVFSVVLATSALLLPGASAGVRKAKPTLAHRIAGVVTSTWRYEAAARDAGKTPPFTPSVVKFVRSTVDPRYLSVLVQLRDKAGHPHGAPVIMIFQRGSSLWPIEGPAVAFTDACASGKPAGVRSLICPDPWAVLHYPRPDLHPQTSLTQPIPSSDLRKIDWRTVLLPGGVCGSSQPIRLSKVDSTNGGAAIHPDVDFVWWNPVEVNAWYSVSYGRLGNGHQDAALGVMCANAGGTADGQLAFSVVVFEAVGKTLRVAGILRPHAPLNPYLGHVPLESVARVTGAKVVVKETWYGAYDGTCCGSGRATTTWTYRDGRFHPHTGFVHKPWASPIVVDDFYSNASCGDECSRAPLTPKLRFTLLLGNYGPAARNVRVTLQLKQGSREIRRTEVVSKIKTQAGEATLVFRHFRHLKPGSAKLTIAIHERGAFPFAYHYRLTRPE
jgi:hypothetical protein